MYASHWKKNENLLWWTSEIFPFISFGIAWTGRINLIFFLGYNIYFLSIWPFMSHPCFPTKKVSKVAFFILQQQNSHCFISWLFFISERKNPTFETFSVGKQGWGIKVQMLRKSMLYPNFFFRFIRPVHAIPKRINGNISKVHHRKFSIFFSVAFIHQVWMVFARIGDGFCFCY